MVRPIAYVIAVLVALGSAADAQALRSYAVVGGAIPASLTGAAGDAARGRALVVERTSTCILCHSGPFPEQRFQGDVAPSLAGTGSRWSEGEIRLRLVDASRDSHFELTVEEKAHLDRCYQCQQVFGVLVRAFSKQTSRGNGSAA